MNVFALATIPEWILLLTVLLLIIYLYKYATEDWDYFDAQNVKSVGKIPFIGIFWTMIGTDVPKLDTYYYKKFGKVWGAFEGTKPTLMVGDIDLIKALTIQDFGNFTDRRYFPVNEAQKVTRLFLTNLEGDEWKTQRNALSPTFTSGKLRQISSLMEECAQEMVDGFRNELKNGADSINAKERMGIYTMDVIARYCFGYKINTKVKNDPFVVQAATLFKFKINLSFLLIMIAPKLHEKLGLDFFPTSVTNYFTKVIDQVISSRKKENTRRNDFLQLLLDAQIDEENKLTESNGHATANGNAKPVTQKKKVLTQDAVVAHAMLFLLAGFESTASIICFVIHFMACHPEYQEKLANEVIDAKEKHGNLSYDVVMELPYLNKVVSETLRIYPVAPRLERRCSKACKLGDIHIRKDMLVSVPVYSIHHDENYYPNPEVFDPERFSPENKATRDPFTYMPFGVGPRNCVGMRFALLEVKMAVAYLIHYFVVSPSKKTEIPIKFRTGIAFLQAVNGVHLKFEERKPSEKVGVH